MLYKNTVFYNQRSPFPARIFVSNMCIKSVTVHGVNPAASSLTCTSASPRRLGPANWKRLLVLLLRGPSHVLLLCIRVRQKLDTSARRAAAFRNLFGVSCVRGSVWDRNLPVPDSLLADYTLQLSSTREQGEEARGSSLLINP